jgi:hypothetical protein
MRRAKANSLKTTTALAKCVEPMFSVSSVFKVSSQITPLVSHSFLKTSQTIKI